MQVSQGRAATAIAFADANLSSAGMYSPMVGYQGSRGMPGASRWIVNQVKSRDSVLDSWCI